MIMSINVIGNFPILFILVGLSMVLLNNQLN